MPRDLDDVFEKEVPKSSKPTPYMQWTGPCPSCRETIRQVTVNGGKIICPECKAETKV